jgi:hypothetical protein
MALPQEYLSALELRGRVCEKYRISRLVLETAGKEFLTKPGKFVSRSVPCRSSAEKPGKN